MRYKTTIKTWILLTNSTNERTKIRLIGNLKKWWHRIFFHFLDGCIVNAFLIYTELEGVQKMRLNDFRRDIICRLTTKACLFPKRKTIKQPCSRNKEVEAICSSSCPCRRIRAPTQEVHAEAVYKMQHKSKHIKDDMDVWYVQHSSLSKRGHKCFAEFHRKWTETPFQHGGYLRWPPQIIIAAICKCFWFFLYLFSEWPCAVCSIKLSFLAKTNFCASRS